MKTISLGKKIDTRIGPTMASKSPSTSYPTFSVEGIALPIDSSHVGKHIKATVTLKVLKAGPEIDEYGDKQKRHRARFEVCNISFPGKSVTGSEDEAEEAEYHSSGLGRLA